MYDGRTDAVTVIHVGTGWHVHQVGNTLNIEKWPRIENLIFINDYQTNNIAIKEDKCVNKVNKTIAR